MSNVAEFGKKVKDQEKKWMENVSWVVGIDMGKEKLFCALMNVKKELICRFDVACSLAGYHELLNRVKKEVMSSGKVVFALEPTGHYWMVLGQFLEDHQQSYVLIHPLVVARSREVQRLSKGKTDALDARLIGELACDQSITSTQIPEDYWATIRFYAREYMDREREIAREKHRMVSYLETTLPDFIDTFPKPWCRSGRACLRFLAHFREASKGDGKHFETQIRKHLTGKRLMTTRVRRLHAMLQQGTVLGLRAGRQAIFFRIIQCLDRLEIYEVQEEAAKQAMLEVFYSY